MKKTRIQLSFKNLTDSKFLTKANFIMSSMTNNAVVFPTPQPTLSDVAAAIKAYSDAFYQADGGSKQDQENKSTTRTALDSILFSLGLWVMFITDCGDSIGLSGFTVVKDPQPRKLAGLDNVMLTQGITSGEISASVPKGNATSFSFEITNTAPTAQTVWQTNLVTTSAYVFQGLVPGQQYYIRVGAIGNRKQLVYSNVGTETAKL
jgi:hypothetical protein